MQTMKPKYRMFRRAQTFWCQDNHTGRQESLGTKDRALAGRLLHARNEAHEQPLINLQIARAYLLVSDPQIAKRPWQFVMDELVKLKKGVTQVRWLVAIKSKSFNGLRQLPILETRSDHFLRALEDGKVSTNVFLRRIHNFALAMNWLPVPVIPRRHCATSRPAASLTAFSPKTNAWPWAHWKPAALLTATRRPMGRFSLI
jgi:hypothetical protein